MKLLSSLLLNLLPVLFCLPNHQEVKKSESFVLKVLGVLFLIIGFIVGTLGLYNYLVSQWGSGPSLLVLSVLFGGVGSCLFLVANLKKHKKIPSPFDSPFDSAPLLRTLGEFSADKTLCRIVSNTSLKTLSALFILALVASHFVKPKNN